MAFAGSISSSPDLLALPVDDATSSPARPSKRVNLATPRRQARTGAGKSSVKIQDFYINTPPARRTRQLSPVKPLALTEDLISPWRIRVRVEAEHEDAHLSPAKGQARGKPSSPKKLFGGDTRIMTVPLKADDDGAAAPKRGRGRPRKSNGTPMPRVGTPKPSAARRRSSAVGKDLDELEETNLMATPSRGRRGRKSGSSQMALAVDNSQNTTVASQSQSQMPSGGSAANWGKRGRRKTLGRVDVALDPDVDALQDAASMDGGLLDEDTRPLASPDARVSSSPLKERSSVSPQKGRRRRLPFASEGKADQADPTSQHLEFDTIMESEGFSMITLGSLPSAQHLNSRQQQEAQISANKPNPNDSLLNFDNSIQNRDHSSTSQNITPNDRRVSRNATTKIFEAVQPSTSLLSRTSQLGGFMNKKAPTQLAPSAVPLPAAPIVQPAASPRPLAQSAERTPRLVRVERAGAALQGVIYPEQQPAESSRLIASRSPPTNVRESSPRERLDDLFSGFGASTRRELRAGLRLGEELAKRQTQTKQTSESPAVVDDDVFSDGSGASEKQPSPDPRLYTLNVPDLPRPNSLHPKLLARQLPSPEESLERNDDEMSWRHDSPDRMTKPAAAKTIPDESITQTNHQGAAHSSQRTQAASREAIMAQREAEWERERQAVSRQIQDASTSQVVVVNSDDPTPNIPDHDDSDEEMDDDVRNYAGGDYAGGDYDDLDDDGEGQIDDEELLAHTPQDRPDRVDRLIVNNEEESLSDDETLADGESDRLDEMVEDGNERHSEQYVEGHVERHFEELDKELDAELDEEPDGELNGEPDDEVNYEHLGAEYAIPAPDEETEDIWQIEAKSASLIDKPTLQAPGADGSVQPSEKVKPPRSKIPSPWRSQHDRQIVYSDDVSPDPLRGHKHPRPDESPATRKRPKVEHIPSDSEAEDEDSDVEVEDRIRAGAGEGRVVDDECQSIASSASDAALAHDAIVSDGDGDEDEPAPSVASLKYSASVEKRVRSRLMGGQTPKLLPSKRVSPGPRASRTKPKGRGLYAVPVKSSEHESEPSEAAEQVEEETTVPEPRVAYRGAIRRVPARQQPLTEPSTEPLMEPSIEEVSSSVQYPDLGGADTTALSQRADASFSINLPTWSPRLSLSSGSLFFEHAIGLVQSLVATSSQHLLNLSTLSLPFSHPSNSASTSTSAHKDVFSRAPSVPPEAHSSPPPLTVHLPWTTTHFRRLDAIYSDGLRRPARYARLAQHGTAARFAGRAVASVGWQKTLELWECGVAERFLGVLEEEGVWAAGGESAPLIDEQEILRRVFGLWCGRVMRGSLPLRDEKVGLWDESLVRNRPRALRRQRAWRERHGRGRFGWPW